MSPEVNTVGMIGFPAAGKTTYAVVFYQSCEAGLDGMEITNYGVGNRQYLNQQADKLAACESLERTSQQQRHELRLRIKLADPAPERELVMPDHSGEFLRDSMSSRVLDERLSELVENTDALMLFVRSDHLVAPETLQDFNSALRNAGDEPAGEPAPEAPEAWEVGFACSQARLTDVAQEIIGLRNGRHLRLVVVLSAWDTQLEAGLAPAEWAARTLPLLVSFLNNEPTIEWEVFGVSAQGGDFNGTAVDALKAIPVEQRPKVQRRDGTSQGIGAPLRWALEPR
jgi:Double-GTPase 1